jgi:antitoxin component YwqK of YwqJK toxin-antitoxin module
MRKLIAIFFVSAFSFTTFSQGTDAQGRKQGYWKKKDDKGDKLIYEGLFKDDKPQGVFKYYYPFDSVKAIMDFRQDGKIAYAKLFHPSGKVMAKGKYINEIKDSVWMYFDEAGVKISKDIYVKGKKNGISLVYLPDGKIAEERNYKMDVQDGPFKQYYDGKLIKGEGTYVNGLLEGKNTYYYPNGVQAANGFYKNGQKTGVWIYKEKDGKIKEKELYIDGKLADKKKTDEFFEKNKVQDSQPKKLEKKK